MAIETFLWAQPQPRIVQYKKKRFALRLEAAFWRQLEAVARKRGVRTGQLVAELDQANRGVNLSSFIRGFCMVEADRDMTRQRLASGSFDLLDILRGAPAPAILLAHDRVILDANQALIDWTGDGRVFRQQKFDNVFEPRVVRPMDETFELMRSGQLKRTQMQIAYASLGQPTRIIMATLTGLTVGSIFYCLVWLIITPQARR
jgi:predicted DNA-binding ribbon-helix-helix protein